MTLNEATSGKQILLPLDGSPASAAALPYAQALATALRSNIRLLTVIRARSESLLARQQSQQQLNQIRKEVAENLEAAATGLRAQGVQTVATIVMGKPAEEILAQANAGHVVLVVMATHGRGGIERWFIGSVADKIMRLTDRPILLVPSAIDLSASDGVSLKRLLLPLDGSALAESALPLATDLARAAHAQLVLAQVPPIPTTLMPIDVDYLQEFDDEELREAAQAYLDQVQRRLPESVRSETALLRGVTPAPALAEYARAQAVDLIVMSTHGRGGFSRFVLGSTADRLVHMGVPVLLVRTKAEESRSGPGSGASRATTAQPS